MTTRQADALATLRDARRYESYAAAAYTRDGGSGSYHELVIASQEVEAAVEQTRAAGLDCDDSGLLL